ncbi:MAG: 5-(carboxyamino)imidazole ribonucleotide synthase [Spirochaetia bacterium]|nr:5-(carboxyamino)imidazole ribonucleotide synthase [Spirochaetia bacterium]
MTFSFGQDFRLGILGGGQLGQMLIQAAISFGPKIRVLDADPESPCRHLAHDFVPGSFRDETDVYAFGKSCDLLTVEIEHVHVGALKRLEEEGLAVFPSSALLEIIQDKAHQKTFFRRHNIPTSDFVILENADHLRSHAHFLPAFQKLRRSGYDGRGVGEVTSADKAAFDAPSVLEKKVENAREISILISRNDRGEVAIFPAVEMIFHPTSHLVEYLFAPADIPKTPAARAGEIARELAEKMSLVGLMAVEMFLTAHGEILVNEVAPRPHNSGHHTIRANQTSQYEAHLRAILGLAPGSTETLSPSAMVNLLGEAGESGPVVYENMNEVLALPGVSVHLYGKSQTRPFRKMGHVTILDQDPTKLREKVALVQKLVRVRSQGKASR